MNILKQWLERQKEKNHKEAEEVIRSEFTVKEYSGTFWLCHLGVPYNEMPVNTTIDLIIKKLEEARETAVRFYRLKQEII